MKNTATPPHASGTTSGPAGEAWQRQAEITDPVFGSQDAREGATAFAEKRDPVWRGL